MSCDPNARDAAFTIEKVVYPADPPKRAEIIQLWRTQWKRTDFDWVDALNGDYSGHLTFVTLLGKIDLRAVATATVMYALRDSEIAVLASVVTHPDCRGGGLAGRMIEAAMREAAQAGCGVCYLGSAARPPHNVYLRHGFRTCSGNVMRRDLTEPSADRLARRFSPDQKIRIRDANWGDLPGVACLAVQPLSCSVIDFSRGLIAIQAAPAERCVSGFTTIWYEATSRGGCMGVLAGEEEHCILGFGSITPGAGSARRHAAAMEFAVHERYQSRGEELAGWLIDQARRRDICILRARLAPGERQKADILHGHGFARIATIPRQLLLGKESVHTDLMEKVL